MISMGSIEMPISTTNIARLNARNRMTDAERREDIMRETFGPMFDRMFGYKPECPGCRERLDGSLICCNPDAVAAHNSTNEGEENAN